MPCSPDRYVIREMHVAYQSDFEWYTGVPDEMKDICRRSPMHQQRGGPQCDVLECFEPWSKRRSDLSQELKS